MKDSRVHTCISQEMVSQGLEEPPARKCNCRKFISYKRADTKVKNGEARWVVTARERGTQEEVCSMCAASPDVKNCAKCEGKGKYLVPAVWDIYNNDIALTSQSSYDKKEKKYRPALAMKTPRVATIESEHIERADVENVKEAQERLEEYGYLILEARAFIGPDKTPAIKDEPADNPKTGEGRNYDYGRAI